VARVALFDLDHTLLPIDSDHAWGVFTTTIGWTDPVGFARRNDEFYAHYKAGTLDIHDYVRFAVDAVRRHGRDAALAAREQFHGGCRRARAARAGAGAGAGAPARRATRW
jgi:phosphoserine phosphatase